MKLFKQYQSDSISLLQHTFMVSWLLKENTQKLSFSSLPSDAGRATPSCGWWPFQEICHASFGVSGLFRLHHPRRQRYHRNTCFLRLQAQERKVSWDSSDIMDGSSWPPYSQRDVYCMPKSLRDQQQMWSKGFEKFYADVFVKNAKSLISPETNCHYQS